jgi:hypothetical protein
MIIGEKNRAQNYLILSNLKLDDVCGVKPPGILIHRKEIVLVTIETIKKSNPLGFPVLILILNQFWYKLQML